MRIRSNHVCGLYYIVGASHERIYLPPVSLTSHTTINPVCFTTHLRQTFQNQSSNALAQVLYTFPLYDGVAVSGYTISYGSKLLKGTVKQKDEAKKTFQAAVDRGETAGLLESLPAGIFGVTIGNVPAHTDVIVEIVYCGELKHDAGIDGLRYNLPTSIAPRYGDYPGELLGSIAVTKGGMTITVDADMAGSAIRKIQSPSHPIAVSMGNLSAAEGRNEAFQPSQASATLALGSTELDQDFILQLLVDDINKPQAIVEAHPTLPNQRALMATLVPKFILEPAHPEIVFIADQSGSMSGSKNDALKRALVIFLKSLPLGVRFNICAFGNDHKLLWPKSQAYNEDNLNTATAFVDSFQAQYGGTEILKPIKAAFENHLADLPLEVMLLTDGEVWKEREVFSYINEQIHEKQTDARVFALGIGSDVSHTLVEGIARAGNGFAQFVTQNEETDQKVIRMLKGALYAHTTDYELEVHYDERGGEIMTDDEFEMVDKVNDCLNIDDKTPQSSSSGPPAANTRSKSLFDSSVEVDAPIARANKADRYAHLPVIGTPKLVQAPNTVPPLFPFSRTTVYLLLGPDSAQNKIASLTVRAKSAQGPLELTVPVHDSKFGNVATMHQLAARKTIQDLEEGRGWIQAAKTTDGSSVKTKYSSRLDELVERECVRLGERFQVAAKWTSFVAVQDGNGEEQQNAEDAPGVEDGGALGQSFTSGSRMKKAKMYVSSSPSPFQVSSSAIGAFAQSMAPPAASTFDAAADTTSWSGHTSPGADSYYDMYFGFNSQPSFACGAAAIRPAPGPEMDRDLIQSYASEMADAARMPLKEEDDDDMQITTKILSRSNDTGLFGNSGAPTAGAGRGIFGLSSTFGKQNEITNVDGASRINTGSSALFQVTGPGMGRASNIPSATDPQQAGALLSTSNIPPLPTSMSARSSAAPLKQLASKAARRSTSGAAPSQAAEETAGEKMLIRNMDALIALQTFSGAWVWSEQLWKLFTFLATKDFKVDTKELGGDLDTCATVLAVAFLETKAAAQRSAWEMLVMKARAYLGAQMGVDEKGVDAVVAKAAAYF